MLLSEFECPRTILMKEQQQQHHIFFIKKIEKKLPSTWNPRQKDRFKIKHCEIYGQSADTNIVTDSFLHRTATSISLCFGADSRTEDSTDKFLSLI